MLDGKEHDHHAGDHQRHVAGGFGQVDVGQLVRRDRGAEDPAVVRHRHAEDPDQHVDQELDPVADLLRHEDEDRVHADVARVAHAHRRADERHVEDEDERHVLGPRRARVEHVAPEHLPGDDGHDRHEPADRGVHPEARETRVEPGERPRPAGVPQNAQDPAGPKAEVISYWSWMRFTNPASRGVLANLAYTGFIASMNSCLFATVITWEPAASTALRDFTSRSSQSLRMYGTDSFAALRMSAWSCGESLSHTTFENTSTSGASECSSSV